MDDLVRASKVSRHAIYTEVGGKQSLFAASLDAYVRLVVDPAFAQVEAAGAGLDAVARFFEHQIVQAEASGLPGAGCLIANTLTEVAPHNPSVSAFVRQYNGRLQLGFRNALNNATGGSFGAMDFSSRDGLAVTLVVFTHGLWAMSRSIGEAATLRALVHEMLQLVQRRIEQ